MLDLPPPPDSSEAAAKKPFAIKGSPDGTRILFLIGLVHFAVAWSAFTLVFDYIMYVRDATQQFRTTCFFPVEVEVLRCASRMVQHGDGSNTVIDIEYRYQVDGKDHTGTRVRYLEFWTNLISDQFVADHPPGTMVTGYYDPQEPSVAVLEAGCDGRELFLPLLLLPFNVVMFGLWFLAIAGIRKGAQGMDELWRGFRRIETDDEFRARLPSISPAALAVIFLFFAPFAIAICLACLIGQPKQLGVAAAAWLAVSASTVAVYRYAWAHANSGKYDLVIDRIGRTLRLPSGLTGGESIVVHNGELVSVTPVALQGEEKHQYLVNVEWRDASGNRMTVPLTTHLSEEQAQDLVERIGRNMGCSGASG